MTDTPPSDGLYGLRGSTPDRVVFDWRSPEWEAAKCALAAHLIDADRFGDVTRHRYAFSLALPVPAPRTAYVHYFHAPLPDQALVPVRTVHTPGVDDLGGLISLAS